MSESARQAAQADQAAATRSLADMTVLVVDDDASITDLLALILDEVGCRVLTASTEEDALAQFEAEKRVALVLQDLNMGEMGGLELLRRFKASRPGVPVVVITAHGSWENTLESLRLGAYTFIRKPFDADEIGRIVARIARGKSDLSVALRGSSPLIRSIRDTIVRVAPTDATVLIVGESGTGKELVARAMHDFSHRASEPFISVNCAAFPENLLESELFGHVRGSFTGAAMDKKGLLEVAEGGTFFLDEIGDMPMQTQVKLLRVLEERQFFQVGGTRPRKIDVRFVGATNRDLEKEVADGRFRADLFYRLNVIPIVVPPLRERRRDIPEIASYFLNEYSRRLGKDVRGISSEARGALEAYDWPGNVRELENTIQRALALSSGDRIEQIVIGGPLVSTPRTLSAVRAMGDRAAAGASPPPLQPAAAGAAAPASRPAGDPDLIPPEGMDLEKTIEDLERRYLLAALERTNWHLTNAAKLLGISFRSIRYKIKKLGLK